MSKSLSIPSSRLALLLALCLPLAMPFSVSAQPSFGPSVVQAGFADQGVRPFDGRMARCAGVVDEAQTELELHCGHNFNRPVTLEILRADGSELARVEDQQNDISLTLDLDPRTRRDLRKGELGLRVTGEGRTISGTLSPPASATSSAIRLEVTLTDAEGEAGGACTALLLGIGTRFWLFDLYLDCAHDLGGEVVAGLFDRTPGSALRTGTDGLLADLGDARSPVLLDWRISQHVSPVGGFFGGTLEIVVTGEQRELRAFLDGCMAGGESVCLHQRFQVSSRYLETISGEGLRVPARPQSFSPGAALFSFTDPERVEVAVNLDDRCAETGFFALRASGMSEQQPRLTVTDTVTGEQKEIELFRDGGLSGPAGQPLSVIDPRAFPCE